MCIGGGDGGAGKIAKEQRKDEVQRQARIRDGMAQIAAIFDGQRSGTNPVAAYDPTKTYYRENGTVFDPNRNPEDLLNDDIPGNAPPGFVSPPNHSGAELAGMGKLFSGFNQQGGFGDEFYGKTRQSYMDYARPQAERQATDAREQLIYALARTGNLDGSAAIKKGADLQYNIDQANIDIGNEALNQENRMRTNVEDTRSGLVSQLNATGDSTAASQAALRSFANLSRPPGFSPLGSLFAGFTQGLSAIGSNAGNSYSGLARGGGRSLFGPSPASQRMVA